VLAIGVAQAWQGVARCGKAWHRCGKVWQGVLIYLCYLARVIGTCGLIDAWLDTSNDFLEQLLPSHLVDVSPWIVAQM